MAAPGRLLPRLRPFVARAPSVRFASTHTIKSQTPPTPIEPSKKQAHPIGPFYQAMLDDPLPTGQKTEEPPVSAAPAAAPKAPARKTPTEPQVAQSTSKPAPATPAEMTAAEKAAAIFGSADSRLLQMAANRQSKSTMVEGVLVPPRPEEPDNCCMSGCVNCVWEQFREDMEDFKAATAEVQRRRDEREGAVSGSEQAGVTLEVDGAVPDTSLASEPGAAKNMWDDSLYQDLPVGIREFMKTERKLKEAHREGTLGG